MKYLLTADIGPYQKGDEVELDADDGIVLAGIGKPIKKEKPKGRTANRSEKPSGVKDGDDG